jgi:hypothetical protein
MAMKISIFRNRVLWIAIVISAAWHIFWLSAFKVIVVPKADRSAKFSSISFLGPILGTSVLTLNARPYEKSAAEREFLDSMEPQPSLPQESITPDSYVLAPLDAAPFTDDGVLTALSASKVGANKMEPGRAPD